MIYAMYQNYSTVLYADDTCVVINGKDMLSIISILNHELHMLSTWLKANKLSLNTDKTYYMIFHRARIKLPDTDYPIIMNNSSLSNIKNTSIWVLYLIVKCLGYNTLLMLRTK